MILEEGVETLYGAFIVVRPNRYPLLDQLLKYKFTNYG